MTADRSESDARDLYRGGGYGPAVRGFERFVAPLRRLGEEWTVRSLPLEGVCSAYDIGAGDGWLVRRLREHGIDAAGAEPFAVRTDDALAGDAAEELRLSPDAFDLVTLWHVLEHLDDPHAVLLRARESVRPRGRVVVAVPNLDSLQARLGGDGWFHQDVPRHAVHFTRSGLLSLIARSGLQTVKVRTFTLDQNLLGMTQTLLNRIAGRRNAAFALLKEPEQVPRGAAVTSLVAVVPAALLGTGLELAASLMERGGSLVVEAVRA